MLLMPKYERFDGFYQLTKDYCVLTPIKPPRAISHRFYGLAIDGFLVLRTGYAWDGASGALDTPDFMAGSLIHDVFCQMVVQGKLPNTYRKQADDYLDALLKDSGMPFWRRWYVSFGVHGWGLWKYGKWRGVPREKK